MRPVMQATALWKIYASGDSTVQAVRGVDVEIKEGEMIAIMGPSGCGKTTLLNVLSGIDEPNSGEVMIDGNPMYSVSDDKRTQMRAQNLGFIFQDFNLLPVLSAVENVELPLLLLGKSASESRKSALEALDSVGLADRSEHRPTELSGGQQQRVAIARAIVHHPKVILCDEPTGNLDSATSSTVMTLLKEINNKLGTTFLLVTHDKDVASQCSRILRMDDGLMVDKGRGEEEE
ncbi:MAG: ABC transporter ATP-binding protein [Euryarchaeota archaeon]|jgi:putative ABC transport system ATP-binding protein|nr:ABC transporter ATP-binding protein [Euryarchaeota archaeon]MBT4925584.1 ABC transporter ATP-binding protein [Euryarchaeota archaeon]MBT5736713.1 ABC transporter ATP-binding protein [Euryarchaeota archaeon]MBT7460258.1 ABC transporter ATP-binding protein [Euryarchaeota archaeon]